MYTCIYNSFCMIDYISDSMKKNKETRVKLHK